VLCVIALALSSSLSAAGGGLHRAAWPHTRQSHRCPAPGSNAPSAPLPCRQPATPQSNNATRTLSPTHRHQAKYDTWVFDCDGTLWKGSTLIEGCKEALQLLRDQVGVANE